MYCFNLLSCSSGLTALYRLDCVFASPAMTWPQSDKPRSSAPIQIEHMMLTFFCTYCCAPTDHDVHLAGLKKGAQYEHDTVQDFHCLAI